jgi:hypothetical protein
MISKRIAAVTRGSQTAIRPGSGRAVTVDRLAAAGKQVPIFTELVGVPGRLRHAMVR